MEVLCVCMLCDEDTLLQLVVSIDLNINTLVIDGSSQVTVTWSAAVHVITETPVFSLETHRADVKDVPLSHFLFVKN